MIRSLSIEWKDESASIIFVQKNVFVMISPTKYGYLGEFIYFLDDSKNFSAYDVIKAFHECTWNWFLCDEPEKKRNL